jgi:hypothetical protein
MALFFAILADAALIIAGLLLKLRHDCADGLSLPGCKQSPN